MPYGVHAGNRLGVGIHGDVCRVAGYSGQECCTQSHRGKQASHGFVGRRSARAEQWQRVQNSGSAQDSCVA